MDVELVVLTLNCWGILGISKDRKPRMAAIANELVKGNFDFVFLQEVWVESDYRFIAEQVAEQLPYSHYFHSGVINGGICIFSKTPFVDTFFHQWSLNGYFHKIHHGDWFGGKGVGVCTVMYKGLRINLYIAHFHAEYDRENDEYEAHRVSQAFETAQLIRYSRSGADVSIVAGDFNTEPGDLPYRILRYHGKLTDSYVCTGKPKEDGATNETPENSYTAKESLVKCPKGKRIDYVMYSSRDSIKVDTVDCFKPLAPRVPDTSYSFSDHEAVQSILRVTKGAQEVLGQNEDETERKTALEDSRAICDSALNQLSTDWRNYWILFTTVFVLLLSFPQPYYDKESSTVVYYSLIVGRLLLTLLAVFCVVMATIWNRMERHGIMSARIGIETLLNSTRTVVGPQE